MTMISMELAAQGIISCSSNFTDLNSVDNRQELPRTISIDFKLNQTYVNVGTEIYVPEINSMIRLDDIHLTKIISERLQSLLNGQDIEMVHLDKITHSVYVVTQDYISKLENGQELLGNLLLNYQQLWYNSKAGGDPKGVERHHDLFKTFSRTEIDMIKHQFIPITASPKELLPIYDNMNMLLDNCVLSPYLEITPAYDVRGYEVQGSRTYWIPRLIAREYLEEISGYGVTSTKIFNRVCYNSGILGNEPVADNEDFLKNILDSDNDKIKLQNFLLKEARAKQEQFKINTASVTKLQAMQQISADIRVNDSVIKNDGPITLGY